MPLYCSECVNVLAVVCDRAVSIGAGKKSSFQGNCSARYHSNKIILVRKNVNIVYG